MRDKDAHYCLEMTENGGKRDNKEVQTGFHCSQVHSSLMYRELKWQKQRWAPSLRNRSLFL